MSDMESQGGDVVEVPAPVEKVSDPAQESPETAGAEKPAVETLKSDPAPAVKDDAPKEAPSFKDIFSKAKEFAASQEGDDEAKSADGSDTETDEEPKKPSDEKIPDEKAPETDEEEAAKREDKADEGEQPKDARDRGRNYREVVEENTKLKADAEAATEKVTKLDAKLAEHGGIEAVAQAMEIFDNLAKGNVADVIKDLPAHIQGNIQREIFETAITQEANRVFGVNQVLKGDFGLEKDIAQPLMEKVFEFVTHRLNTDSADFEAMLDRELEFANTPERENARLKAELERMKNPQPEAKDGEKLPDDESDFDLQTRIQKTHDDYEDGKFKDIAEPEFEKFGLADNPKDPQGIRDAKGKLREAVHALVGLEMRTSKAFEPLLAFWLTNDTENPWFKQADGTYARAMRAKFQMSLKTISKLFAARPADSPNGDGKPADDPKVLASGQGASKIQPPPKKEEAKGFKGAFADAKRAVG